MTGTMQQSGSAESEAGHVVMSRSDSAVLGSVPRDNLTPWEELQLVRRQVGMTTWSQSYDRNLQQQFCKNLQYDKWRVCRINIFPVLQRRFKLTTTLPL
jgi:hypothetical protein